MGKDFIDFLIENPQEILAGLKKKSTEYTLHINLKQLFIREKECVKPLTQKA